MTHPQGNYQQHVQREHFRLQMHRIGKPGTTERHGAQVEADMADHEPNVREAFSRGTRHQ